MDILLIGYGKMGKTIETLATNQGHSILGKIDLDNRKDMTVLLSKADVAIEFTTPHTAVENILTCIRACVPVVCGTTGWLDRIGEVEKEVESANGTFFYASNFSIGVNIFFQLNKYLAEMMDAFPEYNVLMEEVHHTEKKDAPSGTAITLAEGVIGKLTRKDEWTNNQLGATNEVSIFSKRIGTIFGNHEVQYHNNIDTIKISHEAFNREGFAHGALKAAEWIIDKKGIFTMDDMLGLK